MNFILNVFDRNQDSEITFPKVEKKGNLCSGVNKSIILAYCEDLENYSSCRIIMELLRVDELDSVIAADYELLNILLGLSDHGGKFVCIYCEAPKGLEVGIIRTISEITEQAQAYKGAGTNPKNMIKFKSVLILPLINIQNN